MPVSQGSQIKASRIELDAHISQYVPLPWERSLPNDLAGMVRVLQKMEVACRSLRQALTKHVYSLPIAQKKDDPPKEPA